MNYKQYLVIDRDPFAIHEFRTPIKSLLAKQELTFETTGKEWLFHAFLGVITFNKKKFLVLVKQAEDVGSITPDERTKVFLIKDVWLFSVKFDLDYSTFSEETKSFISGVKKVCNQGMYFSFTHDLTNTLQRVANSILKGKLLNEVTDENYLWNKKMSQELIRAKVSTDWLVPLIKGYIEIIDDVINDYPFKLVLISRRASCRAGIFERVCGIDEKGNVANTVETEQIVYYNGETYAFNQLRGSVPVFWTKEGSRIDVTRLPEYSIAAFTKHFDDLVGLYNRVVILNLLHESLQSEMKLSRAFEINEETYIKNMGSAVKYCHFDIIAESANTSVL